MSVVSRYYRKREVEFRRDAENKADDGPRMLVGKGKGVLALCKASII